MIAKTQKALAEELDRMRKENARLRALLVYIGACHEATSWIRDQVKEGLKDSK
jgi:hypothetical protein